MSLRWLMFVVLVLTGCRFHAQNAFVPNAGQWKENFQFRSDIQSGTAYFADDRITYSFYNAEDAGEHLTTGVHDSIIRCYAYEMRFEGATTEQINGNEQQSSRVNYFLGNDPSKWRSNLPVYSALAYSSLYPGIDLAFHYEGSSLKSDFVLKPHADPAQIQMVYNGQKSLDLRNGVLEIGAGFLTIREIIPAAYQVINGRRVNVSCEYRIAGNVVSFYFPGGYDTNAELVIDPELVASTYCGGTGRTYGYAATYDDDGNIYSGCMCLETGYPVTLGAYCTTYTGSYDVGVSKYNPTGTALLYCTYIGGTTDEFAQSMYVYQGNLYLFGSTNSTDFPVTAGAFDQTYNGQKDIYILELNSSGSALLASTYVGGMGDDGSNYINISLGDNWRGEIIVDGNGDVLVASTSTLTGFPVTAGAYSTTAAGGQDAVIFRMNGSLTTMIWATYFGASQNDAVTGIRVDASGDVYVSGSTRGIFGGVPTTPGSYQPNYIGGAEDAFVAKFNASGSTLMACTYYGGTGADIANFIDLDHDGNVYIYGVAQQGAPVTAGVYAVPGSTNFIAKLDPTLSTLLFSTVIGDGTTTAPITPTAFMVDHCNRIFISGFGASAGWPVTPDALYTFTAGSFEFYVAMLDENATSLLFATFYGGWHVDGGSSRFDPDGYIYQAVCQDGPGFPTTPGAYSDGVNGPTWSACVFKIDCGVDRNDPVLPNVFTPDDDGINDEYDVGLKNVQHFDLHIYDRWGLEVFHSNDPAVHWDGTYQNHECAEGVYYVALEHGYCFDEPSVTTGFVHLLRNTN